MINLLSKIFIKGRDNTDEPRVRHAYGVLCGAFGVFLNILLFGIKLAAGMIAGSVSITADAFNNLSDAGSSVVSMVGFRMAGQKPDPEHPFGHGRIEYVTGLVVSMIIILMGFELLKSSFNKIVHPELPTLTPLVALILILSIFVKLYMYFYNKKTGERFSSMVMKATGHKSLKMVMRYLDHISDEDKDRYFAQLGKAMPGTAQVTGARKRLADLAYSLPLPEVERLLALLPSPEIASQPPAALPQAL